MATVRKIHRHLSHIQEVASHLPMLLHRHQTLHLHMGNHARDGVAKAALESVAVSVMFYV
jgi:hypothetical protein